MRNKKLFILTGNVELRKEVIKTALKLKAFNQLSLYDEVITVISKQLRQPREIFDDPKLASKPFKNGPFKVEAKHLSRFAGQLSMGILPKSLANKTLSNAKEALRFFMTDVATTRWGKDWAVNRFCNNYVYLRDGVYVLNDGEEDVDYLKKNLTNNQVILVAIEVLGKNGKPVASPHPKESEFVFQYAPPEQVEGSTEVQDAPEPAMLFLSDLKTKFFQKR